MKEEEHKMKTERNKYNTNLYQSVVDACNLALEEDNVVIDETLIDCVTDDLANEHSYRNDWDKYQGVNRDEYTYERYYDLYYPLVKDYLINHKKNR